MVNDKLKIAFVHNAYIEYRIPLFENLNAIYNIKFFFEWFDLSMVKNKVSLSYQLPKSFKITNQYSFSPTLFLCLIKGKYNFFIAGAVGQINTYITFFISRLLRKPFIFWDENWYWPCTSWGRRLIWPFLLQILKNAEAIIVPGSKSKTFYSSIHKTIKTKIFVAPNSSTLPLSKEVRLLATELKKLLSLEEKQVVLFCGRLIKVKGFEYLLKAFSTLQENNPNIILIVIGGIYGTGNRYGLGELERIYRLFGRDKVRFKGTVVNPEKAAYFLIADVVVVPSIFLDEEYEVWGFAVNEAASASKPIVATTAVGAAYDLVQNERNGYMIPDKDPTALFKAIKVILDNPAVGAKMGEQSLIIVQEGFTYINMSRSFKEAITFVLSISKKKTIY